MCESGRDVIVMHVDGCCNGMCVVACVLGGRYDGHACTAVLICVCRWMLGWYVCRWEGWV